MGGRGEDCGDNAQRRCCRLPMHTAARELQQGGAGKRGRAGQQGRAGRQSCCHQRGRQALVPLPAKSEQLTRTPSRARRTPCAQPAQPSRAAQKGRRGEALVRQGGGDVGRPLASPGSSSSSSSSRTKPDTSCSSSASAGEGSTSDHQQQQEQQLSSGGCDSSSGFDRQRQAVNRQQQMATDCR